jgi:hypothetical protein
MSPTTQTQSTDTDADTGTDIGADTGADIGAERKHIHQKHTGSSDDVADAQVAAMT